LQASINDSKLGIFSAFEALSFGESLLASTLTPKSFRT